MATDAKDDIPREAQTPRENPPTQAKIPPKPLVAPDGTELAENDPAIDLWWAYYQDIRRY
jgi:hypothetical protein